MKDWELRSILEEVAFPGRSFDTISYIYSIREYNWINNAKFRGATRFEGRWIKGMGMGMEYFQFE